MNDTKSIDLDILKNDNNYDDNVRFIDIDISKFMSGGKKSKSKKEITKEWKEKNVDKVKKYNKSYYKNNKEAQKKRVHDNYVKSKKVKI